MQILIVLSAMLVVVVTPFLARWEAPDLEWSEEADDAASFAEASESDVAHENDHERI